MIEKASSKKLVFWVFLIVFIWLAVSRMDETKHVLSVLVTGRWYWLAPAILCQFLYYPFYAYLVDHVFKIFRLRLGWRRILPVFVASKFTDVALPVATFGMVAIFLRSSKKQNISTLNTGIGISFVMLFEVAAFALLALLSLVALAFFGHSLAYLYITLAILIVAVILVVFFLISLAIFKRPPNKLILWLIKFISRLAGYKNVKIEEIEEIFQEIGADVEKKQDRVWRGFWLAIGTHLLNMVTLAFIFCAFIGHFDILAILAGYTAGLLYTIVSITPQGVGVVETVMVATIHSFKIDIPTAAVITLVFRSLLYWLPVFAGFYSFSRLEFEPTEKKQKNNLARKKI